MFTRLSPFCQSPGPGLGYARAMTDRPDFIPYRLPRLPSGELLPRAEEIYEQAKSRRTVRDFSPDPVPREVIEYAIRTASTAPSGAHRQPWTFVLVAMPRRNGLSAKRPKRKSDRTTRAVVSRVHWREALEPLGTTSEKPFLETAPWLVVVFEQRYGLLEDGSRLHHYYVKESVGIACGIFIATLHRLGLATLTHTPSPMAFLSKVLERPENERPFILFPSDMRRTTAPCRNLTRKSLDQVMIEVG